MTSKEFIRRLESFKSLDSAAGYFLTGDYDYIYHVEGASFSGFKIDIFQVYPYTNYLSSSFLDDCLWVYIDAVSKSAFEVQLGYFKGFLARLSVRQFSVLECSHKVDNLLKYCNRNNMSNS